MKSTHLLTSLCCAAIFAGCASTEPVPAPPPPPPTMAVLLQQADLALKVGKPEEAVAVLKRAARIYPADKTAWLRIAQVSFECQEYGDAITNARKVLERDPDDMVAHSIAAVSGLRVSSKALADLTKKHRVDSDVRGAAHELAKILRSSIGGEIIPPDRGAKKGGAIKSSVMAPATAVIKTEYDPFGLVR